MYAIDAVTASLVFALTAASISPGVIPGLNTEFETIGRDRASIG